MSQSDSLESKGVTVPYVGIERVIDLLTTMHRHGSKEKSLEELATLLGCTRSNLNNVTPTLAVLHLAEVKQGKLILSIDGLEFADNCTSDPERAKRVIKKNLQNSEVLMFTKSLLETRSSISGEEIGRALAERFKKDWKDIRTYRNFGNSCASILAYSGIGYFSDGVLSIKPPTLKSVTTFYPPSIGYNPMIELIRALHGFDRAKTEDIAKRLGVNSGAIYNTLTICTTLKLVERQTANTYSLTDSGRHLIDPIASPEEKSTIFRKCLLNSPYGSIIERLARMGKEMGYDEIGDTLAFFMKSAWSDDTKRAFAKKFITWLNNAGLSEKVRPGLYKVKLEVAHTGTESPLTSTETAIEEEKTDINSIYEVGRAVGSLESVITVDDKASFFGDRLVFLKELLAKHEDLRMALDMLATNFDLALKSNNPALYKSNLDFIREKIKEKVLGGTAH